MSCRCCLQISLLEGPRTNLTTPRGDHVGSPGGGGVRPSTHLVDELETVLVGLALVLELDLVERHGGGGLESDDTGREEGGSLRGRNRSGGRGR